MTARFHARRRRPGALCAALAGACGAAALLLAAAGTRAAAPPFAARSQPAASIPFANLGGIRDWQAEGSRAIRIQAASGAWYRASFARPCQGLPLRDTVAFVTDARQQLDRFGALALGPERCAFRSFERLPDRPQPAAPQPG